MWGWKPAMSERPTSRQMTFLFGGRHSKRDISLVLPKLIEVPNFSPSLSFRFNFSVQIPGFSMANSGQLASGSGPWSTLLAGLECHSATKKILQLKCNTNIAELFSAPKQVFPVYPEHRCRAKDTEKPHFGSLPGPAPKPFYSLSVGLISDDFLAVEKAKLCGTFVSEPGSLFCDWWQFFRRSGSQQIALWHGQLHHAHLELLLVLSVCFFSRPSDPATFLLMPSRSTTVSRMKSKSDKVMPASPPCLVSIVAFFCLAGTYILLDVFQGLF